MTAFINHVNVPLPMNEKLIMIGVRVNRQQLKAIKALAQSREWTVSQTARKLIETALSNGSKKR